MRFVTKSALKEGMVLGKPLYGTERKLLLKSHTRLTERSIRFIKNLDIPGIYISDEVSQDIDVKGLISDELRLATLKKVERIFSSTQGKAPQASLIIEQVDNIIDELFKNKNVLLDIYDFKMFDNYTYAHSVNVAILALTLGISLGLPKPKLSELGFAALIHDIGKMLIDQDIINKTITLTELEYKEIMRHPALGCEYAKETFDISPDIFDAILDHHEKYGGGGYPSNKCGEEISLYGRIIALADVYDTISSDRPHRKALSPSESIEYIMGNAGSHFDPMLAGLFIRKIAPYPVGTTVKLSNGLIGIVVKNHESLSMRPVIRIIKVYNQDVQPFEVDLGHDRRWLNVTVIGFASV